MNDVSKLTERAVQFLTERNEDAISVEKLNAAFDQMRAEEEALIEQMNARATSQSPRLGAALPQGKTAPIADD